MPRMLVQTMACLQITMCVSSPVDLAQYFSQDLTGVAIVARARKDKVIAMVILNVRMV